jgi:hypothetical protein
MTISSQKLHYNEAQTRYKDSQDIFLVDGKEKLERLSDFIQQSYHQLKSN